MPCKHDVFKGKELVKEAECLWTAETTDGNNQHNLISATWGCIALLKNPERSVSEDLLNYWTKRVFKESNNRKKIISAYGKEIVINQHGFLKIPWPKSVDGSVLDFDALLATVTRPKPDKGRYPSAQDVAEAAYESAKGRTYFWRNRKYGIETFQDKKIANSLGKCED